MEAKCNLDGCEHYEFHNGRCACHLDMETDWPQLTSEGQQEAIRIAALENDSFEVNAEGEIRLEDS